MIERRLLLVLIALLAGCAAPAPSMRDDVGRAVTLPRSASRIVTLAPNLTEIAFAIGAGARVVATDDSSDVPPAAAHLPKVGGVQPSVERIVAARPDLVFALASSSHQALGAALAAAGIPLYVVRTDRLDDVPRVMSTIGAILGEPHAGAAASALRNAIAGQQRHRARTPRVLFTVWTEPLYVAGKATFTDDLFALTGARNIVQAGGWPQYSVEAVLDAPPELILYPGTSVQPAQIEALLAAAPPLRGARVIAVDESLFTRPGPRVAEAARELNRILDQWQDGR